MAVFLQMTTNHTSESSLSAALSAFSEYGVSTSLYTLRSITETVDSLCELENIARAFHGQSAHFAEWLERETRVVDPEDKIIDAFERVYTTIEDQILPLMANKRAAIDRAHNLQPDHRSLLHSAYDGFMEAHEAFAEAIKSLRAAVINHDLAVEAGKEPVFDDPEELFKSIKHSARR